MKKAIWIGFQEMYDKFPTEKFAGVYNMLKPMIMIRDPELIKMILVKDFQHFNDRGFTVSKEAEPVAYNMSSMTGKLSYQHYTQLKEKLCFSFNY